MPAAAHRSRDLRHGIDRRHARRPDRREDERTRPRRRSARVASGTRRRSAPSAARARGAAPLSRPRSARARSRRGRDGPGWRERATIAAASTPVEAVSSMWPANSSGRPTSCRSQSTVTSSSSWSAGDVRQRIPTWLSPAMRSSASTPGSAPGRREIGEEARALPVREPRQEHESRSSRTAENGSGSSGGEDGQRRADRAGLDLRQHRELAHALEVRRDPVERERAVLAERRSLRAASRSRASERVFSICSFVSHARRACATPSSA